MTIARAKPQEAIRVVIIEDSELQAEALRDLCEEEGSFSVVGMTAFGTDGVLQVLEKHPDIVLCDLGLPDISGFEVITQVMSERPTPIVVVTATLKPTWRRDAFDAVGLGAIDVMEKPSAVLIRDAQWRHRFRRQLRVLANTKVIPHVLGRVRHRFQRPEELPKVTTTPQMLAVVASAGGPQAVSALLESMASLFPLSIPMVIGMHLGPNLAPTFVEHLKRTLNSDVLQLEHGMELSPGTVYVLRGGCHTQILPPGVARIVDDLPETRFKPSFNFLLSSIAKLYEAASIAVILSGMGDDGARGLLDVRKQGGLTLGQDEGSSAVYGMPKAAAEIGAVRLQQPPEEIGQTVVRWLQGEGGDA